MKRSILAATLTLGGAASLISGSGYGQAAPVRYPTAPLLAANSGFGYAMIHGPDAAINAYATPRLLAKAPSGHLVNLTGLMNIPRRFAYTVDSSSSRSATVIMRWIFGTTTVLDRLVWVPTTAGWRIDRLSLLRVDISDPREAVTTASYEFAHAVIHGPDSAINRFATARLLSKAPARHLVNLLHLQNIPGDATVRVNAISPNRGSVTVRWTFGKKNPAQVVDRLFWLKTASGWKIDGISHLSG